MWLCEDACYVAGVRAQIKDIRKVPLDILESISIFPIYDGTLHMLAIGHIASMPLHHADNLLSCSTLRLWLLVLSASISSVHQTLLLWEFLVFVWHTGV